MLADTTQPLSRARPGRCGRSASRSPRTRAWRRSCEPTLERWFTEPFRKSSPAPVAAIGKLIASTPVAGYVGCCHAIPKINITARLKEIKAPILVLCGDKDPGTPPAMAEEIHRNAPGSKLVMIPDAAHLANLEQPAAFTKAMQDFLAAH